MTKDFSESLRISVVNIKIYEDLRSIYEDLRSIYEIKSKVLEIRLENAKHLQNSDERFAKGLRMV